MNAEKMSVEDNSIYISFNQYLQNQIDEMKAKPILDSKGADLNQTCETLLSSSLLKHLQDVSESNF